MYVVRERWRDAPSRFEDPADYAASSLEHSTEQLDYYDCTENGCDRDCDLQCNVRLSDSCGGATRLLPVDRGTWVLLLRVCASCEAWAGETASTNYRFAVMAAYERAAAKPDPAWARTAPRWMRWRKAIRRWFRQRL
ncbi:hypothetical protein C5U48_05690 [Mycolicibacter virginiensis]|uniref:Uncharacterized protein n=1 Tax=Mycolicibacter virginiensis TaxID=1795032 RepID=A0A9X7IPP9_9MYCO|nr:hypothetical protein C5U48_05690 [Mycolicibacter virginiensis]